MIAWLAASVGVVEFRDPWVVPPVDRWFSIFSFGVLHRVGWMLSVSTWGCILLTVFRGRSDCALVVGLLLVLWGCQVVGWLDFVVDV